MFSFLNYLKLIATVLITNSHLGNIWPVSALATGGLLGNVIFLSVSGFLLYNIKTNFVKWFSKRFFRVYPALLIFTLFTVLIGEYPLKNLNDAFKLFIYPTNYIFLVWLLVCYCIFYFVVFLDKKISNFLEITTAVVFVVWIIVYVICYDKSVYRVDNVSEPFVLFLYIESMMIGAFFKKQRTDFTKFKISKIFLVIVCLVAYFASKIIFSRVETVIHLQIVNQFVILLTLFSVFDLFMSMEHIFKKVPEKLNLVVKHISNITLQIYIVQFVIIRHCDQLPFPINLIVVTLAIIVVATLLYYIEYLIRKLIDFLLTKARK